jgi:hypothetical protein
MASLALVASLVVLSTILIGPLAYLLAKLKFPSFFVYILSILSIINGIWFASIGLPIWYVGLVPIYFGYISIQQIRKTQGRTVDNR